MALTSLAAKNLGQGNDAGVPEVPQEEASAMACSHCQQPSTNDNELLPVVLLGLQSHGSCPGAWLLPQEGPPSRRLAG